MENKHTDQEEHYHRRSIGEMVIARRRELNWTQDDLEYYSGVSVRQISRIESNQSKPSIVTIEKLEKALGISLVGTHRKRILPRESEDKCRQKQAELLCKLKYEAAIRGLSEDELIAAFEKAIADKESDGD